MRTDDYERCLQALIRAAENHAELTTDDVWLYLEEPPSERNTVGKAFSEAARVGWIEGTERFVKSKRPEAKGRRVQVWKSLIKEQFGLFA